MNTKEENKFSMYLLVQLLLNTFNTVWAGVPGFVLAANEFFGKITGIKGAVQTQGIKTKGIAKDKKAAKDKLITKGMVIIGAIQKFATDTNNNELYEEVNFTESELRQTPDGELEEKCNTIFEVAMAHSADIAPEGITAVMVGDFNLLIVVYGNLVSRPTLARGAKKAATANLKLFIKQNDVILKKKLDKLMLQFEDSNSDFYNRYKSDRKVLDLGIHHTRLGGVITDAGGNLIEDAIISVTGTDLIVNSDENGIYLFKPFIPGDFSITVEKTGFIKTTVNNVHVSPGQHLVLDVTLAHLILTGVVNSGQIVNGLNASFPFWVPGITFKIKNTSTATSGTSLYFYLANSAVEGWSGHGSLLLPGQEEIHTPTAAEFKAFMNIQNQGGNAGTFEVTIM